MATKDQANSIFLELCNDFLKSISHPDTRQFTIRQIIEPKLDSKASEGDFVHHKFIEVLNEMYIAGFQSGSNSSKLTDLHQREIEEINYHFNSRIKLRSARSYQFALKMRPVIEKIRSQGPISLQRISDQLTEMGFTTITGSKWNPSAVKSLESRIERMQINGAN